MTKKLTRQQRRKNRREFNKTLAKEGKTVIGKRMLDDAARKEFEDYKPSSSDTAVMPFCMVFNQDSDLNDYIHSCKEGAEVFLNNDQPKIIIFIREKDCELPATKKEMMKIGTRIFYKKAPHRVYIFLECEGSNEDYDIIPPIREFFDKLGKAPEDGPQDWLSEYIFREEPPNEQV